MNKIIKNSDYSELDKWLNEHNIHNLFLVCGESIKFVSEINNKLESLKEKDINVVVFDDFQPNPLYQSIVCGVNKFKNSGCDGIMAIGGGSAIDVAKCIKLFSNMRGDGRKGDFLAQNIIPNHIPFLVIPTTAGTGSEATRFAVIYYDEKKQSISDYSCIPDTVLLDGGPLRTLPLYQRKSTMCDAFCHAVESFWSVNSSEESKVYSKKAIDLILRNMEGYLNNNEENNFNMLIAANYAGRAINITQTTAGHAMCYSVSGMFKIAHGHAAFLCVRKLLPWMASNLNKCIDKRGEKYLSSTFDELADCFGCSNLSDISIEIEKIFHLLDLDVPIADETQFNILKASVNLERLRNNPIELSLDDIDELYHKILKSN